MMYFLDTNTCIYFLKGTYPSVLSALRSKRPKDIKIPSIVKAELLLGAEKSQRKKENLIVCEKFLEPFEVISFDDDASIVYSKIRAALEKKGTVIGPNDMIIAATVCSRKGILVTNNTREFKHVPHLSCENWTV
jgi:tRNA(fMet)-specific endonuclease VapC